VPVTVPAPVLGVVHWAVLCDVFTPTALEQTCTETLAVEAPASPMAAMARFETNEAARGRVQRCGHQKEEPEVDGVADQGGKNRNHERDLNQALTFLSEAPISRAAGTAKSRLGGHTVMHGYFNTAILHHVCLSVTIQPTSGVCFDLTQTANPDHLLRLIYAPSIYWLTPTYA
jgi:hypothetical protein